MNGITTPRTGSRGSRPARPGDLAAVVAQRQRQDKKKAEDAESLDVRAARREGVNAGYEAGWQAGWDALASTLRDLGVSVEDVLALADDDEDGE